MLDAYRALVLASAATGALKNRFFRNVLAHDGHFGIWPVLAEVLPDAEDHLLRIQHLARIVRRTVLRAPAALHTRVRLQRHQVRDVLAGVDSEVFIAHERRNFAELSAREEYRDRTQDQVQMLRMRQ